MTNAMEQKLQMIEGYIGKLEDVVTNCNRDEAKNLQIEIIGVYGSEIEGLKTNLDNYSSASFYPNGQVDFIRDAKLLKAKLTNYKLNLESGLYKPFQNSEGGVMVTQHVNQDTSMMVIVTLKQTIDNIQELPDAVLSAEEKEVLSGKIAAISAEKDKQKKWEKVCGALKWIADKGVQVGIATLPYIVKTLENNA